MRLGVIVSDFPKVTETFILRDLMYFHRAGHEIRIFHLTPYRRREVVHEFARETLSWVVSVPALLDRRVWGACWRAFCRRPRQLRSILGTILRGFATEPVHLAKALAMVPKNLAIAEILSEWKADHVHAEFAGHPATSAWIAGRMAGLPYSVSCHAHDIFLTQGLLAPKLLEASFVRCISEFNRCFLIERIPALSQLHPVVIHCGVDTARIEALSPPSGDERRILFVGSLEERKGVPVLLRALATLRHTEGWMCEVIGGGPDRGQLEKLAARLRLADRVLFHGPLPFEEVSQAIVRSHLVVVPSIVGPGGRSEGIPTVLMEALAHRRPVIASRLSGIPELVRDGVTGYLVPPGDSRALAEAIRRVFRDPEEAFRTARAGRALVQAEFDSEANARARLKLYLENAGLRTAGDET